MMITTVSLTLMRIVTMVRQRHLALEISFFNLFFDRVSDDDDDDDDDDDMFDDEL